MLSCVGVCGAVGAPDLLGVDGAPVAADPPFWRARSNLIRGPLGIPVHTPHP